MTHVVAIGTYLPTWGTARSRCVGDDEDAVTLAVAAGLAALDGAPGAPVARVVLATRRPPLLEGGNSAALLAGLGLPSGLEVVERLGGACATADAVVSAGPDTLVIGVDVDDQAGAAAVLTGHGGGLAVTLAARVNRSLPVVTRDVDGGRHDYADPRLLRERGLLASMDLAGGIDKPTAVAGLAGKQARALCAGTPPELPTVGASAPLFALAALVEDGAVDGTILVAVDQASLTALRLDGAGPVRPDGVAARPDGAAAVRSDAAAATVTRDEPAPRPRPALQPNPGPDIPVSLPAYDRAFDTKLRWAASRNTATGQLDFPPRARSAQRDPDGRMTLVALPRTGSVYTLTTINVAVPGKPTPYTLAIVSLDGAEAAGGGVRALVTVTGAAPGGLGIGDRGRLVFRRVAVRSGVPDYSYAFHPVASHPDDSEQVQR